MSVARRGRKILVESVIAGGVVGAVEAVLATAATRCNLGTWLVVAALAGLGAIAIALILNVTIHAVRVGPVARWAADLQTGGPRRTLAVWHAVMLGAGVLVVAVATFMVAVRVHNGFVSLPVAPGLAVPVYVVIPLAIAALIAGRVVHRRYASRIAMLPGGLDAHRAWIAGSVAVIGLIAGPILVIHHEIPALILGPVIVLAVTAGVVLAVNLVAVSRYRAARITALAVAVGCTAGAAAIGCAEHARWIAVETGSYSKEVAKVIWRVADRDGDGYAASWAGGADCDDNDPRRSPGRRDIIGNGIDENCTGADAVRRSDSIIAASSTMAAVQPAGARGAPRAQSNLILISVDALRADHLGAWGYARPTSPAIDRFAADSTRFAWAMTSSPSTKRALPSMLTGRHASEAHGGPLWPSIAEVLRDAGWETRAVLCCEGLPPPGDLRGFTSVDISAEQVRVRRVGQANADALADTTIEWLSRWRSRPGARRFFLWVHFYDPHEPYQVPPDGRDFGHGDIDRYDAEIAFTDRGIGRLLDSLQKLGLASTTVVAITADHGEEFGEHGVRFHSLSLYNQGIRIPLIIHARGCQPRVIEQPVSLIDLAPTVLELAGVQVQPGAHERSLAPVVCGDALPAAPVLVELVPERYRRDAIAMVTDRWKVIWDREANAWMLFARSDPAERNDLSDSDPATLAMLKSRLLKLIDQELAVAANTSPTAAAATATTSTATATP